VIYLFQKLDVSQAKIESGKLDPVYPLSDEMKRDLADFATKSNATAFDDFSSSELYSTRKRLNERVKQFHFRLEVIPQVKVKVENLDIGERDITQKK
jgi:precorrin-2 methylase